MPPMMLPLLLLLCPAFSRPLPPPRSRPLSLSLCLCSRRFSLFVLRLLKIALPKSPCQLPTTPRPRPLCSENRPTSEEARIN